ncbi:MAG: hypothetical protein ACRDJI_06515 [Actinomycetota bacterium]
MWGGLIPGAVIGGIGGRLAMLVLRLTSDSSLHGLKTDDEFVVGKFSGETFFLVLFTTALGVLGGLFYLGARGWIPERHRALVMGLLAAAVGGSVVIRPDGIDFTLLEPLWLAVVMFIALPALYGVAMSMLVERFLVRAESHDETQSWVAALLPLAVLLIAGPFGLLFVLIAVLVWNVSRRFPLGEFWNSAAVIWVGRTALVVVGVLALTTLVKDVGDVL